MQFVLFRKNLLYFMWLKLFSKIFLLVQCACVSFIISVLQGGKKKKEETRIVKWEIKMTENILFSIEYLFL